MINDKWYLVGANPIYVPMVYTPRMRKILQKDNRFPKPTLRDSAQLLIDQTTQPPMAPEIPAKDKIAQKRDELRIAYTEAAIKWKTTLNFEVIVGRCFMKKSGKCWIFGKIWRKWDYQKILSWRMGRF